MNVKTEIGKFREQPLSILKTFTFYYHEITLRQSLKRRFFIIEWTVPSTCEVKMTHGYTLRQCILRLKKMIKTFEDNKELKKHENIKTI